MRNMMGLGNSRDKVNVQHCFENLKTCLRDTEDCLRDTEDSQRGESCGY